jgi:16S rRNA (guanine1207-N2)-methyltransferase
MSPDEEAPVGGEPYFAVAPRSRPSPIELRFLYRGELLTFTLDRGIFASRGLDPGSALLIQNLGVAPTDRVLDLGCGWGAVGVAAAKSAPEGHVVLTDVNRRAARLARQNLARNRIRNAEVRVGPFFEPVPEERFDVIATNPPYRIGREQIIHLLEQAPGHLSPGGRLLLVGKGSEGIRYYQGWLEEHGTGPVTVLDRRSGYRVLEVRTPATPSSTPEATALTGTKGTAQRSA